MKKEETKIMEETMETVNGDTKDVLSEESQNEIEKKPSKISKAIAFVDKHRDKVVAGVAFFMGYVFKEVIGNVLHGNGRNRDDLEIINVDPVYYSDVEEVKEDSYSVDEAE